MHDCALKLHISCLLLLVFLSIPEHAWEPASSDWEDIGTLFSALHHILPAYLSALALLAKAGRAAACDGRLHHPQCSPAWAA